MQFWTILFTYKKCVNEKRTSVNKGWNLLNPYLLMVLLSIPFDKLLCGKRLTVLKYIFRYVLTYVPTPTYLVLTNVIISIWVLTIAWSCNFEPPRSWSLSCSNMTIFYIVLILKKWGVSFFFNQNASKILIPIPQIT